jgi:hypothetical protein
MSETQKNPLLNDSFTPDDLYEAIVGKGVHIVRQSIVSGMLAIDESNQVMSAKSTPTISEKIHRFAFDPSELESIVREINHPIFVMALPAGGEFGEIKAFLVSVSNPRIKTPGGQRYITSRRHLNSIIADKRAASLG